MRRNWGSTVLGVLLFLSWSDRINFSFVLIRVLLALLRLLVSNYKFLKKSRSCSTSFISFYRNIRVRENTYNLQWPKPVSRYLSILAVHTTPYTRYSLEIFIEGNTTSKSSFSLLFQISQCLLLHLDHIFIFIQRPSRRIMRSIPSVHIFIPDLNHLMCERTIGEGDNRLTEFISFPLGKKFGPDNVIESTKEHAKVGKCLYQYCMK